MKKFCDMENKKKLVNKRKNINKYTYTCRCIHIFFNYWEIGGRSHGGGPTVISDLGDFLAVACAADSSVAE